MTTLSTLPEGARFRLPLCGKVGSVVRQGSGSTLVKYEAPKERREFKDAWGETHVIESDGGARVSIAPGALVEAL